MRMVTNQVVQVLVCLLCLRLGNGQIQRAICVEDPTTATSFQVVFKVDRQGTTDITGLTSYAADEAIYYQNPTPGTGCATTTLVGDIYTLSYTVDTTRAGPPTNDAINEDYQCGVSQSATEPTEWNVAIKPEQTANEIYVFTCDTDLLQPVMVSTLLTSGHVTATETFEYEFADPALSLYVIRPNGNIHVDSVVLGTPIQLRITYQDNNVGGSGGPTNELASYGPNLFGDSFHVATVPLAGGTIMIQVSTLSPSTSVTITGQLATSPISLTQTVSRSSAWELPINDLYFPTSTDIDWIVELKSLKIEATPDPVGVKVVIEEGTTDFAAYMAYPDDLLAQDYRGVDYLYPDGQLVIIGTVDGTTVTLDLTAFDTVEKATITIAGQPVGIQDSITVTLNEYETLHIHCDDCSNIGITSDENIAVINGGMLLLDNPFKDGYTMNQIPPLQYLDTDFVQFPKDQASQKRVYYTTGDVGQAGTYSDSGATNVAFTDEVTVTTGTVGSQVQFSVPAYAYTTAEQSNYQSYVMLPGVRQWTTQHFFYLTPGYDYDVKVIAKAGQIQFIEETTVTRTTQTRTLASIGGQIKVIDQLNGEPAPIYEFFQYTISDGDVTAADMYEWRAPTPYQRFLVVVTQTLGQGNSARGAGLLSFGTAFPTINPCTPNIPGSTISNGIDDDCDGLIDEGIAGQDNDFDGLTDEDNGGATANIGLVSAIRVKNLYISDNLAFADPYVKQILSEGCNLNNPLSAHAQIDHFEYSTALQGSNPGLWVMDTEVFRAYRFHQVSDIYYRAEIEICYGGEDFCKLDSCATGRKKRASEDETGGHIETRTVDMKLKVTRPETVSGRSRVGCGQVGLYWTPHVLLVLIIISEGLLIGIMLYRKSLLKRV